MKLLVGMVTYGQVKYTRMALKYLYQNTNTEFDFIGVVGKPGDTDTIELFRDNDLIYIIHSENKGFPASLNDIYEYGFVQNDYDYVIIMGNDVLPYPNAIDYLVEHAEKTKSDYVSSQEISIDKIKRELPYTQRLFGYGKKFLKDDFPEFMDYKPPITDMAYNLSNYKIIGDTHNLSLFSRNWFNSVGYVDVNFYPAYFEDNDYARRGQLLGMKMYQLQRAKYFHFWSRTIKEDVEKKQENDFYFPLNKKYYKEKWGGEPGKETYTLPFNGKQNIMCGVFIPPKLKIDDRIYEERIIKCWKQKRV